MNPSQTQKGKIQIQVSRGSIDLLVRTMYEDINNIKLKNERFQKKKRAEDERRRRERYAEIQQEAIASGKKNAALEMKWAELKELDECEELNREMQDQQQTFQQIIEGKENLRKEFEEELKRKDDEYVKMLKEQSNDIKDMISKMRSQFYKIRDANMQELEDIERHFEQERSNLLNEFKTKIEATFKKHNDLENQYVLEHAKTEEEQTKNIEDLRIKGAKHYAELKITMETEIQDLEKCFEDMKALYQLITEKLDYSLKVLQEKFHENNSQCDELKRRENNYKNRLKQLTKDYKQYDKKFKLENKNLTQEYKRIIRQFKELQKKFKHFEKADLDKYSEIQKMNEAEVKELKDKIIKCNITIHIQQLGMQWIPPQSEEEILAQQKLQLEQGGKAEEEEEREFEFCISEIKIGEICNIILEEADFLIDDKLREELEGSSDPEQIFQRLDCIKKCLYIDSEDEMNLFFRELITKCRVKSSEEIEEEARKQLLLLGLIKEVEENENPDGEEIQQQEGAQQKKKEEGNKKDDPKGKEGAKDSKENANPQGQNKPNQDDKKKKKDGQDDHAGQGQGQYDPNQGGMGENQEEGENGEGQENQEGEIEKEIDLENTQINLNEVVKFLQNWQANKDKRKERLEKESSKKAVKQETEREKKERIAREGKKYWEKLTQVLPERTFRIWNVLDRSLSKYYELLLDRQKLIEETSELHNQNEELKNLLNQYIQIDHELIIRPTRLINIDQGQR
ncbi:hypothetical protein ABPG72_011613 [Tetrahymena utriculariae]